MPSWNPPAFCLMPCESREMPGICDQYVRYSLQMIHEVDYGKTGRREDGETGRREGVGAIPPWLPSCQQPCSSRNVQSHPTRRSADVAIHRQKPPDARRPRQPAGPPTATSDEVQGDAPSHVGDTRTAVTVK